MAEKKIWIMSPHGIKIPASVLGHDKDLEAGAFEEVKVPEAYGRHLIADKFAVEVDPKNVKPTAPAKKVAETKALEAAEKAVADAKAAVTEAGEDDAKKAVAEAELANATAALEKLQAA